MFEMPFPPTVVANQTYKVGLLIRTDNTCDGKVFVSGLIFFCLRG